MSVGYIYILSNPSMPDVLKIGMTNRDVKERVKELSSATSVPKKFEIEYYCLTRDVEEVEKETHNRLSKYRQRGKEFFKVGRSDAISVIDSLVKHVLPDRFVKENSNFYYQTTSESYSSSRNTPKYDATPTKRKVNSPPKPFDPNALQKWQERRYNKK